MIEVPDSPPPGGVQIPEAFAWFDGKLDHLRTVTTQIAALDKCKPDDSDANSLELWRDRRNKLALERNNLLWRRQIDFFEEVQVRGTIVLVGRMNNGASSFSVIPSSVIRYIKARDFASWMRSKIEGANVVYYDVWAYRRNEFEAWLNQQGKTSLQVGVGTKTSKQQTLALEFLDLPDEKAAMQAAKYGWVKAQAQRFTTYCEKRGIDVRSAARVLLEARKVVGR